MRRKTLQALALLSIGLGIVLSGQPGPLAQRGSPAQDATVLESGEVYAGTLTLDAFSERFQKFTLDVPRDAVCLWVELTCRRADLDLYVTAPDDEEGPTFLSEGDAGVEWILIDRLNEPGISDGTYGIEVACYQQRPRWDNRYLSAVEFQLEVLVLRARSDGVLSTTAPTRSKLDFESGGFRSFTIDVPAGAQALRLDLTDTPGDLDVMARRRRPILRSNQASHLANQRYGRETLLITKDSQPPLRPGKWYVDVLAYDDLRVGQLPFTLYTSFDESAPEVLRAIPELPRPRAGNVLEPALCAVVDLYTPCGGGSGTFLNADGLLLTNAHVVADYGEQPVENVVVAATLDRRSTAVELFRGTIVLFDMERDLALVQIETGLYGQSLPNGYTFPFLERGDSEAVAIGQELWMVGYPSTGARGERPLLSATRGIICGFGQSPFGALIKTDAEISSGNSGGAALDAAGRLIAVPTSIVEDGSGQLAYLVPLSHMPEAFQRRIGK